MAKLKTLKQAIPLLNGRKIQRLTVSSYRITGSRLQRRRFAMWKSTPYCKQCNRLVEYPNGFELDHVTALYLGGQDSEDNCQILCLDCHSNKTKKDLSV